MFPLNWIPLRIINQQWIQCAEPSWIFERRKILTAISDLISRSQQLQEKRKHYLHFTQPHILHTVVEDDVVEQQTEDSVPDGTLGMNA